MPSSHPRGLDVEPRLHTHRAATGDHVGERVRPDAAAPRPGPTSRRTHDDKEIA